MKWLWVNSVLVGIGLSSARGVQAQTSDTDRQFQRFNNYSTVHQDTLGRIEQTIHTFYEGHEYLIKTLNGELADLRVDEEPISSQHYVTYDRIIEAIRDQLTKDQLEATGKQGQLQASSTNRSGNRDQLRSPRSRIQSAMDQVQIRSRGQVNAPRPIDADQQLMSQLIDDLMQDGMVKSPQELVSMTLSTEAMKVNEQAQSTSVLNRYKAKYSRWAAGNFSYGGDQPNYQGIHLRRRSY